VGTQSGSHSIPATISDIEDAVEDENARASIFQGTAQRVLGVEGASAAFPSNDP
jgi:hypothetical protein